MAQAEVKPKKKGKKKNKNKTVSIKMDYVCQASAEMMIKIFTMREPRFLQAVFYGQIKQEKDEWIIGDSRSFQFKIIKEEITEDDEYTLNMLWHRKEWNNDEWSQVNLIFIDDGEIDKKCELEFKQKGIPKNDKHGNPDQANSIKIFWQNTIFKNLTQFGNIGCKEKQ
eukprot:110939_1